MFPDKMYKEVAEISAMIFPPLYNVQLLSYLWIVDKSNFQIK